MICIRRGRFECIHCQMTQMSQTHLGSLGSCLKAVLRSAWSESTSYAVLTCSLKTTMAWWICSQLRFWWFIKHYILHLLIGEFFCVSYTYVFFLSEVWSVHKDFSGKENDWWQRSLQTKYSKPRFWKVRIGILKHLHTCN